jgi:hypothetical protein
MQMARSSTTESSNPTPSSDHVSAEADGVRTEAEVVADEQANAERAANEAPPGATGNPATAAELAAAQDEAKDGLVHFQRVRSVTGEDVENGTVQSVDAGSVSHQILVNDRDWVEVSAAKAKRADVRHSDGFAARQAKAKG